MRTFKTGANRDDDKGKLDYEACTNPLVERRFAEYIRSKRKIDDGSMRLDDNWQKGMPLDVWIKSGQRHNMAWRLAHRGYKTDDNIQNILCALRFNIDGYLLELLEEELCNPKDEA